MDDLDNFDSPEFTALRLAVRACLRAGNSSGSLMDIVETEEGILEEERAAAAAKGPPGSRLIAAMEAHEQRMANASWKLGSPPEPRRRPGT